MDWSRLRTLRALDDPAAASEVASLVTVFRESAIERVTSLRALIAAGELQEAGETAHALCGSCSSFGAMRLAYVTGLVEHECEYGDPGGDLAGHLAEIETRLNELLAELDAIPGDLV